MANYAALKATIDADIRSNGEQLITGPVLNGILTNILAEMGQAGFLFKGMAHPGDTPAASDSNLFYLAVEAGQYSGFDGRTVTAGQLVIFAWDGTWASDVLLDISGKANKNGDPAEAFTVFTLTAISNIVGQTVVGKTVAGDKVTVHNDDNNATTDLVPGGQSEDIEVAMPSKDGTLALQEDVDEAVSQLGQEVEDLDLDLNGGTKRFVDLTVVANNEWINSDNVISYLSEPLEQKLTDAAAETYPSADKVAEMLSVSKPTLWRWEKSGYLIPVRIGGKVRYKMSDVKRILGERSES